MSTPADPSEIHTLLRTPDLIDPVLVVHFDGWIDAGVSAGHAVRHLVEVSGADPIVSFDTEWLIDHRARRPIMHIVDGVTVGIDWPEIEIAAGRDQTDRDVLILHGAEPDHNWRTFIAAVIGLAERFGVRRAVAMGAYPAAVPHTRPSRLTITSPTVELARSNEPRATLDVPAGMSAALEQAFDKAGIEALTMWAQVPHYIPAGPYPAATQALIEGLAETADLHLPVGALGESALATRNRLDALVAQDEGHVQLLRELEAQWDRFGHDGETLPTSDELAEQVEEFLRAHDDDTGSGNGSDTPRTGDDT